MVPDFVVDGKMHIIKCVTFSSVQRWTEMELLLPSTVFPGGLF